MIDDYSISGLNRSITWVLIVAATCIIAGYSSVVFLSYREDVREHRSRVLDTELPAVMRSIEATLTSYFQRIGSGLAVLAAADGWATRLDEIAAAPDRADDIVSEWERLIGVEDITIVDIRRATVYPYWADGAVRLDPNLARDAWFFGVWDVHDPPTTQITCYYDEMIGGHAFYFDQLIRDAEGNPVAVVGALGSVAHLATDLRRNFTFTGSVYLLDANGNVVLEVTDEHTTYLSTVYGTEGLKSASGGEIGELLAIPIDVVNADPPVRGGVSIDGEYYAAGMVRLPVEGLTARVFLGTDERFAHLRRHAAVQALLSFGAFAALFGAFLVIVAVNNRRLRTMSETIRRRNDQLDELVSILTHNLSNDLHSLRRCFAGPAPFLRPIGTSAPSRATDSVGGQPIAVETDYSRETDSILLDMEQVLQNAIYSARMSRTGVRPMWRRLDIGSLLRRLVDSCGVVASEKNQTLRVVNQATVEVNTDEDILYHIVLNFLGNATKFSPRGSEVLLEARDGEDAVEIVVADQGPGFSQEDRQHLFQKSRRLSARPTGGERSTGMGLYVARRLADSLSIELDLVADSRAAVGATDDDKAESWGAVWVVRVPRRPRPV